MRYFLISYLTPGGYGDCTVSTTNGFVNRNQFVEDVAKKANAEKNRTCITSIFEFRSEEDFNEFNK
jgi:hypothetical protein